MSTFELFTDVLNSLTKELFWMDFHLTPVENMYNFSDPNMALPRWTDLFSDVISKYASPQKTALIQT